MNREIILIAFVVVNAVLMIMSFGNMHKINQIKPMNDAQKGWYISMIVFATIIGFLKTRWLLNKVRTSSK